MERNYFIHNSSQEELPPPSQLSVEATTQRELDFDPYPNGKCPRSKCAGVRKQWDDCCESIAHIVEECTERLRDFSIWLPPPVRPSRQRLVDAVAYTYWSAKAEEMDCTEDDLDLHLPLPECMAGFYSNLEAIFADFDREEQERAVNGQMGSPVLAWEDDDDDAVGLVADNHHAPSHSAAVIASCPLLYSKRLGQSTLFQSSLHACKNSPSQKKQKLHSGP
jgi:hypothetical protein